MRSPVAKRIRKAQPLRIIEDTSEEDDQDNTKTSQVSIWSRLIISVALRGTL